MTRVFISGLSGRMGQEVKKCLEKSDQFSFCGGMSREGMVNAGQDCDVVVDFSLPEALSSVVEFCKTHGKPLVSGTTGLKPEHNSLLIDLSKHQPVFWAANMSFGIYIMSELIKFLGEFDNGFTYNISETHHTKKIDTPSGTAIMLEKAAKVANLRLEPTESIREGEVFGVHRFIAHGEQEKIEITHEAFSRELFAQGALRVAQWLVHQRPGFYGMADYFEKVAF